MNQIKTIFLLGILTAVLIAVGGAMGKGYLYAFTGLAILINFGAYFFSDRVVLSMHRAREVSPTEAPALHRMVAELARSAEIPEPRLFIIPEAQPNAFATGRNPAHGVVAVTEGLLRLMNERQIRGVLAHEIAHIRNRDILVATVAASIAAAVTYIAQIGQFAAIFGGGSQRDDEDGPGLVGGLLMLIVAPIAATLIQLAVSRSREYMADRTGAKLAGDPEGLASALERLHESAGIIPSRANPATASLFIINPLSGKGIQSLFSTHPAVEERVRRLRMLDASDKR